MQKHFNKNDLVNVINLLHTGKVFLTARAFLNNEQTDEDVKNVHHAFDVIIYALEKLITDCNYQETE